MRATLKYLDVVLLVACGAVFLAVPAVDLAVSGWFYRADAGFFLRNNGAVDFIYHLVPYVTRAVIIGLVGFLLLAWTLYRRRAGIAGRRRIALYLLVSMLLGPGLLVNTVFKDQWGRARPHQVEQFGGDKQFTPALLPAGQCAKNCSFVSGHASVGFYFVSLFFLRGRRRWWWLAFGTGFGALIGLVRMVQGGHFLSDVVFAFFAVYFTAKLCHWLMFRRHIGAGASATAPP